jgi:hypothetical protein
LVVLFRVYSYEPIGLVLIAEVLYLAPSTTEVVLKILPAREE